MSRQFQRRQEDFRCAHCGREVHGDGYTNHCPQCLWSQHVDRYPGDRLADCGGMMAPVEVELRQDKFYILHCCQVCGATQKTRAAANDDHDAMISVAAQAARRRSYSGDGQDPAGLDGTGVVKE